MSTEAQSGTEEQVVTKLEDLFLGDTESGKEPEAGKESDQEVPEELKGVELPKDVGVKQISEDLEVLSFKTFSEIPELIGLDLSARPELKEAKPEVLIQALSEDLLEQIYETEQAVEMLNHPSVQAVLKVISDNPGMTFEDYVRTIASASGEQSDDVVKAAIKKAHPSFTDADVEAEFKEIVSYKENNPDKYQRELKKFGLSPESSVLSANKEAAQREQQERLARDQVYQQYAQFADQVVKGLPETVIDENIKPTEALVAKAIDLLKIDTRTDQSEFIKKLSNDKALYQATLLFAADPKEFIGLIKRQGYAEGVEKEFGKFSTNPISNSSGSKPAPTKDTEGVISTKDQLSSLFAK